MRNKFSLALFGLLVSSLMVTAVFAQDVYVTKNGKKYHKSGSRFIKGRDAEKLSREEAESLGYKPSSEILRDDDAQAENSSQDTSITDEAASSR